LVGYEPANEELVLAPHGVRGDGDNFPRPNQLQEPLAMTTLTTVGVDENIGIKHNTGHTELQYTARVGL
jgi:hypothetical protein